VTEGKWKWEGQGHGQGSVQGVQRNANTLQSRCQVDLQTPNTQTPASVAKVGATSQPTQPQEHSFGIQHYSASQWDSWTGGKAARWRGGLKGPKSPLTGERGADSWTGKRARRSTARVCNCALLKAAEAQILIRLHGPHRKKKQLHSKGKIHKRK